MVFLKNFKDKIGSKYTPKITKLHHFKKNFGSMPPNPLTKRIDMHVFKSEKK